MLCVANIGDTNAVLRRQNGEIRVLTVEHNAGKNESEVQRINEGGGFIVNGKVIGSLSVTRAFGDLELKKWVFKVEEKKMIERNGLNKTSHQTIK